VLIANIRGAKHTALAGTNNLIGPRIATEYKTPIQILNFRHITHARNMVCY